MGRHGGWIACSGGIAGGADYILVPEKPIIIDDVVCELLKSVTLAAEIFRLLWITKEPRWENRKRSKNAGLDSFGHVKLGGIGEHLAKLIEKLTGYETRAMVLGHVSGVVNRRPLSIECLPPDLV